VNLVVVDVLGLGLKGRRKWEMLRNYCYWYSMSGGSGGGWWC